MNRFYTLLLTWLIWQPAVAQTPGTSVPLFADTAPLSLTLTTQLQILNRDRVKIPFGEKPEKHPAVLTMAGMSAPLRLPVSLTVRGNYRREAGNCIFPPLVLDLPKKRMDNTVFANQNKLKLVTHCQADNYIVREYLVYKVFNELTDLSFRARLAQITYSDTANRKQGGTHWAILLEDNEDVAKRNGARLAKQRTKAQYTDSLTMAMVGVFEYMIGNTDWSVSYQHNVNLLADTTKKRLLVVPYDFDYAGIVGTSYAIPDKHLNIESVRTRLYRGPSYSAKLLSRVFDRFNEKKKAIYALYEGNPLLEKSYIQATIQYLDEFYTLINNPKRSLRIFGPGSTDNVVIRGLND
ncbi:hypothetical protein J2I47_04350 [Fibrella sp. HMF5335]|uniref:Uncharacterized protein n=1 Tax=Fibrella rubiginis TaxID=2817060 RepID=A0A939GB43_9BACT|nr:hypothetical protein [Fibrella rubiginis]MBO0935772.1 hypothetical protein [Fibrella rubiginis]